MFNSSTPLRILIVGPAWVGDMVMAQSLFITLKQQYPDAYIDVLAPAWTLPLLERMPEVRQGLALDVGHGQLGLTERWRVGRALAGQYDWAILLPNSWKSALVPYLAGIPHRTGYLGELRYGLLNDYRRLDKTRLPRTVQRFVALAYPQDAPLPPPCPTPSLHVTAADRQAARAQFGLALDQPLLALCPGAEYGPAKRWPAAHFAQLARDYQAQGWQVALLGSAKDQPVAAAIRADAPACVDLCGKTPLARAIDVLALADAVVSNDSGLMHVAAALQRPLVAIYGSSDPGFTPPLSERARIVRLGLNCSPCFKRDCPFGHTRCLSDISPAQVQAELERL